MKKHRLRVVTNEDDLREKKRFVKGGRRIRTAKKPPHPGERLGTYDRLPLPHRTKIVSLLETIADRITSSVSNAVDYVVDSFDNAYSQLANYLAPQMRYCEAPANKKHHNYS